MQSHREPVAARFRWALGLTFRFAALFSTYVLVMSLLRGSTSFDDYGLSTLGIVAFYWLVAILAAIVLGLLKPFTRYRFGTFAVGTTVGFLVYASAMLALPTTRDVPWWLALIPGLLVGGGLGVVWFDEC